MLKTKMVPEIDQRRLQQLIKFALDEDLGDRGDVTSQSVLPEKLSVTAMLVSREAGVCAGLPVAEAVFHSVDAEIRFCSRLKDGEEVLPGTVLAEVSGAARSLLTAERTALNFLQRLCGIATVSAKFASAAGERLIVLDTRKTTPGWRNLEKYAVACGGASNHRIGLYDRVMIKDNHRELAGLEGAGGIRRAVAKAREHWPELEVEVEADTLDEVREALAAEADYILLDNMSNAEMAEAVRITAARAKLEASGNITIDRIPEIAGLGVDFVSVGALTHSVKALDIGMDIIMEGLIDDCTY